MRIAGKGIRAALFSVLILVSGTLCAQQQERALFSTALNALPPEELLTEDRAALATWNIRIFSNNSRDDDELIRICMILSEFDFIALQELRDTEILDRTVTELAESFGKDYDYIVSPETGRGVAELYAFLYDTAKVTYTGKSYAVKDPDDLFIREPFLAGFKTGEFDFYAITIHSIYGDSIKQRRAEARLLDDVYRAVLALDDEEDILLFGDFNLPPEDIGFNELRDIEGMNPVNRSIPTTIYGSTYDNIWYREQAFSEGSAYFGVYPFDETVFGNDDKRASKTVSDHRPLWILVDTAGPDDD